MLLDLVMPEEVLNDVAGVLGERRGVSSFAGLVAVTRMAMVYCWPNKEGSTSLKSVRESRVVGIE